MTEISLGRFWNGGITDIDEHAHLIPAMIGVA